VSAPSWDLLAVDFGTSHTVAVLRGAQGRARPVLFDGSPLLPSAVCAQPDGTLAVGRDAIHLARDDPARFEPNPKRRIGEQSLLLGDRAYPVVDVVAAVLARVVAETARTVGTPLPPAVLTHPESWAAPRRDVLRAAAARAGLDVLAMVSEPVAAARYYTAVLGQAMPVGQGLAVFDLGGGTLDVAVLRRTPEGFAVAAAGGAEDLGGVDLDAAVVAHVRAATGAAPALWQRLDHPVTAQDRRDRAALWTDARAAKEMLSRGTLAPVHVPGLPQPTHLTRAEFERAIASIVDRAVDVTARTLDRAGGVAGLFLVGGATRVPLVAQRLHQRLGLAPAVLEQPEIAVAEGALHELGGVAPHVRAALDRLAPAPPPAAPVGVPAPRRRGRRLAAAATVVAVLAAAGAAWWVLRPDGNGDTPVTPDAGAGTPSPSFLAQPPTGAATEPELRQFVAAWDKQTWGEGCRVPTDAGHLPDGKLNNEFGLDVVAAPTTAVHCRSGDFEAIFALYPGDTATRVEAAYAKDREPVQSERLSDGDPVLYRLPKWGTDRTALMWRRGHAVGWLLSGRSETDLVKTWTTFER
jgi:Ethanolamine utilization protein EutJ (predicted chaperonin)